MTIEAPYLSQLLLLGLLGIIGWLVKGKLAEVSMQLRTLELGQQHSRERLIRIEAQLSGNTKAIACLNFTPGVADVE